LHLRCPRKLRRVALNLFQKKPDDAGGSTQFAATMIAMPGEAPAGPWPGGDSTLSDSALQDSSLQDSALSDLTDSAVSDSSASGHAVPDVVTDFGGLSQEGHDTAVEPTLSHIGRYALKRQLGEGGLGAVYEAWDPLLSRAVAVKTLQFDVDARARVSLDGLFLNEARAAAGLSHKYIVTIHDAGLSAHGVYIAMERLYGRDLQQALAQGWRPTMAQSVQLVRRIAEALSYAHARGVVHCDIKPANIFLTRRARPKVLDFGIARVTHGSSLKVLEGTVAGSPRYRAPEQLSGGSIDARTDLFSLGAVLYELLCGEKAFEGGTLADINQAVLDSRPRLVHEVRPAVPEELSRIVARMMAREPVERYATAADVVSALRRWAELQPAEKPAASGLRTAAGSPAKAARRRLWAVAALLLAAAGAVVFGLVERGGAQRTDNAAATESSSPPAPVVTGDTAVPPPALPTVTTFAKASGAPEASPPPGDATAIAAQAPVAAPAAPARQKVATDSLARTRSTPVDAGSRETRSADSGQSAGTAAMPGVVMLAVTPWGHIDVDGQPAGATPPLSRLSLAEGAHTITVRNADFPPHTVQVQVSADRPVTIRHRFGS